MTKGKKKMVTDFQTYDEALANTKNIDKSPFYMLMRLRPKTQDELAIIANELIEWSELPDTLVFKAFPAMKRISHSRLLEWAERSPYLKEAIELAKANLAHKRETGAIMNKFNVGMVLATQPLYDPEYKELLAWKAALKNDRNDNDVPFIVLEKAREYKEVPHKEVIVLQKGHNDQAE